MLFVNKKTDEAKRIEELNNPHKGPKYSKLASKNLVIQAKDIQKSYTNGFYVTNILKGVNLNIYEGEFVVILGPSGSGKTTLMNIMSGLDRATDGYMNVLGSNLINLNDDELTKFRRINIGYIFQQYGLIPNLKVKENIEIGLYLQEVNKKEATKNKTREIESVKKEWENELANGPSYASLKTIIPEGRYSILDYIWLKCPLDNTSKKIIDMVVAPEKYNKQYIDAKYNEWIQDINDRYDQELSKSSHDTIEKIMEVLNIQQLANKYPNELSGGQQQRVSIARSFAKNPKILFADEPTGAVDLEMSEVILNAFLDINKTFNTTIIVVTHNPDIAKLASKVVYFEDGHIKKIEQK